MENFVGTWKQTSTNNIENFLKSTDLPEDALKMVMAKTISLEVREVISVSGQEVTIIESSDDSANRLVKKGTIGQESDFKYGGLGETNKLLFTLLDDGCLFETLVGRSTKTTLRKVEGTTMTHVIGPWSVTCYLTYADINWVEFCKRGIKQQ